MTHYYVETDQNAKGKWRWVVYGDDNLSRVKSIYCYISDGSAYENGVRKKTMLEALTAVRHQSQERTK